MKVLSDLWYKESIIALKRINCMYFGEFASVLSLHGITSADFLSCLGKLLIKNFGFRDSSTDNLRELG